MDGSALTFCLISIGAFITAAAMRIANGPEVNYVVLIGLGMLTAIMAGIIQSHRRPSK